MARAQEVGPGQNPVRESSWCRETKGSWGLVAVDLRVDRISEEPSGTGDSKRLAIADEAFGNKDLLQPATAPSPFPAGLESPPFCNCPARGGC